MAREMPLLVFSPAHANLCKLETRELISPLSFDLARELASNGLFGARSLWQTLTACLGLPVLSGGRLKTFAGGGREEKKPQLTFLQQPWLRETEATRTHLALFALQAIRYR